MKILNYIKSFLKNNKWGILGIFIIAVFWLIESAYYKIPEKSWSWFIGNLAGRIIILSVFALILKAINLLYPKYKFLRLFLLSIIALIIYVTALQVILARESLQDSFFLFGAFIANTLVITAGFWAFILLGFLNHKYGYAKVVNSKSIWPIAIYIFVSILVLSIIGGIAYIFTKDITTSAEVSGFTGGIMQIGTIFIEYFTTQRQREKLEKQKTEAELSAIKAHINPHFLFNALNTIYNEADREGNETSAQLVQELASILRFTLQESKNEFTSIEKEIGFVEKYISLQKARLPKNNNNVSIIAEIDYDEQPASIAPLLLIPFIENAFQYAISFEQKSFIELHLTIENKRLTMNLRNSISPNADTKKGAGTGTDNAQKRLSLTYPNRHKLMVNNDGAVFEVNLEIDL